MNRRQFIALLGVTAAWPQAGMTQRTAIPVVGLLSGVSRDPSAQRVDALREGLEAIGYIEGQNVAIEYRWAEGRYGRLPAMAADLVQRRVSAIATMSDAAIFAA